MKVFKLYLKFRKITDLKMIKTIALIKDFDLQGNQVEQDVLGAKHSDITMLMALRELYYDRLEPVKYFVQTVIKVRSLRKGGVWQ